MVRMLGFLLLLVFFLPLPAPAATWYVDAAVTGWHDGHSWETAFASINRTLQSAGTSDEVVVAPGIYEPGVYVADIEITQPNIVLRSKDPLDPATVAGTVIRGSGNGPVVTFSGDQGAACVLEGFTMTNGAALDGGGINGNGTLATIRNNIITGNVAYGPDREWLEQARSGWDDRKRGGGAIYWCNGLIENNVISDNLAGGEMPSITVAWGGGLCRCHGTIRNNTIVHNKALGYVGVPVPPYGMEYFVAGGGGLAHCNGIIEGNYIADNVSDLDGGGLYSCGGLIQRNVIARNVADLGGGLRSCSGWICNNLVVSNSALKGGGLLGGSPPLYNNTIVANRAADEGGGLHSCNDTTLNCILWANTAPHGAQLMYSSLPTYSCIQDWTGGGEGNISEEPRFVDEANGDFRLRADSPCIDAGFNSLDLPEFDIAGMHRIMFGGKSLTVDMGAYEFYVNKLEPVPGTDQAVFTWSSLADKTYSIFYSEDLFNWHTAIANFPSLGNETTYWTDDGSLTGIPPLLAPKRFYRLLENP